MNEIVEILSKIEQESENLKVEYDAELELVHQKYRPRIETNNKRYESYYLVAEEMGLLNKSQSSIDGAKTQENDEINSETILQEQEAQKDQEVSKARHPAQKYALSIGDAVEQIFKEVGMPLSLRELRIRAEKLGVTPSPSTFRSSISKDTKKRFERVSDGVYKLRDDVIELTESDSHSKHIKEFATV